MNENLPSGTSADTQTERLDIVQSAIDLIAGSTEWAEPDNLPIDDIAALKKSIVHHFSHTLGRDVDKAAAHYLYQSVALAVRERLMSAWHKTAAQESGKGSRRTFYLSLEYLMGRTLGNALHNLEMTDAVHDALRELGIALEDIEQLEQDAGLGNGGLGRLAACFLDSAASLALPVRGYGLRYRYGMFRQLIDNGWQVEQPDDWLANDAVWELERPHLTRRVRFGGHVRVETLVDGQHRHHWEGTHDVFARAYDVPVPGYRNGIVNTLRLWSSTATNEFHLNQFNAGGYAEAVAERNEAENITMVLYPNDSNENGKVLRLRQQYFLVSASLQDAIADWLTKGDGFDDFHKYHCFQLNDTHPALAIAELMRLLLDEHGHQWKEAWAITTKVMAYTNHTLLPEALECWSLEMMQNLLPRPTEIIQEINRRFVLEVKTRWPGERDRHAAMSIVTFDAVPVIRMAHLAIVGSFSVNGVAALHSRLLTEGLFKDFNELWPERFNNKTNGVTQRRWLSACNPDLRKLLDTRCGKDWIKDPEKLEGLTSSLEDAKLLSDWQTIKHNNKLRLANFIQARVSVAVDPSMLFDVQVKRMHEYKRQLLCTLHAVHCWLEHRAGRSSSQAPRMILIAGKAAPGYAVAKDIIKLINNVSKVINNDEQSSDQLKLVFLPDYNVSAMELICPATDLSEQISTAGKEASGTGNMKFMMNGALTIGTRDGANVEILEAVGEDNFFAFGLNDVEVEEQRMDYQPQAFVAKDPRIKAILDAFETGTFDDDNGEVMRNLMNAIQSPTDPWMTIADLSAYLDAQADVSTLWNDQENWTKQSIINTAMSGRFSSDRTIADYNRDIWQLDSLAVNT